MTKVEKQVVNKESYVTIVGGTTVDIIGFPYEKLVSRDSNPGTSTISLGGVGRNIGENLARFGIDTKLISVIGNDTYGKMIMDQGNKIGLDTFDSLILEGNQTSTYICILNTDGDMELALSSMDIFKYMTISFIEKKRAIIENSKLCVIDTNLPIETIKYIVMNLKQDYFLDTVSTTKAMKVKDIIGYFHTIKPNKIEAEILSGMKINDDSDLKKVSQYFLNKGVKRVFITLGKKGVYYYDGMIEKHVCVKKVKVKNATGSGDAFMAGLAYSYYNDLTIDETLAFSVCASIIALENENTINPNISSEKIMERVKEIKLC